MRSRERRVAEAGGAAGKGGVTQPAGMASHRPGQRKLSHCNRLASQNSGSIALHSAAPCESCVSLWRFSITRRPSAPTSTRRPTNLKPRSGNPRAHLRVVGRMRVGSKSGTGVSPVIWNAPRSWASLRQAQARASYEHWPRAESWGCPCHRGPPTTPEMRLAPARTQRRYCQMLQRVIPVRHAHSNAQSSGGNRGAARTTGRAAAGFQIRHHPRSAGRKAAEIRRPAVTARRDEAFHRAAGQRRARLGA